MKITMLSTRYGSEDGFVVNKFERGQSYDVAHTLAARLINRGHAIEDRFSDLSFPALAADFSKIFGVSPHVADMFQEIYKEQ